MACSASGASIQVCGTLICHRATTLVHHVKWCPWGMRRRVYACNASDNDAGNQEITSSREFHPARPRIIRKFTSTAAANTALQSKNSPSMHPPAQNFKREIASSRESALLPCNQCDVRYKLKCLAIIVLYYLFSIYLICFGHSFKEAIW
jgi:hypothetical protein